MLSKKSNVYLRTALVIFPNFNDVELHVVQYLLQRKRLNKYVGRESIADNLTNKYDLTDDEARAVVKKVCSAVNLLRRRKSMALEAINMMFYESGEL